MYYIQKGIRDKSVAKALKRALEDDSRISEAEVRSILDSTLDGKGKRKVNKKEYHDLMMILRKSKSISNYS